MDESSVMLEGLQISKFASSLITLFIPSIDQSLQPIDQAKWQDAALEMLGTYFGGATAFPKGKGVWRDDRRGGLLMYDETIVVQCFTILEKMQEHRQALKDFLIKLGTEANQGAVGFVLEGDYFELSFPIKGQTS